MATAAPAATKFQVTIVYNGLERSIDVNEHEAVQAALQSALNTFDVNQQRENFGLFTEAGQQLDPNVSIKAAGVAPGAKLLLRPRQVSGGS